MNVLSIEGLHKRFGSQTVLDSLDLQVARGEIVGLLGPNGCGKSTTLNIVCGLLEADAGQVRIGGEPVSLRTAARVGLCPQASALYRDLLPAENLDFFARLYGLAAIQRRRRVDELMQRFELTAHAGTRAGRLSGGWQQRLNLAVALVHGPQLLVLDEPTAAVDVQARLALWGLIEELRDGGMTIVLTTHQIQEAERLCSRVALMRSGRVAAMGSVPELLARVPAQAVAVVQTKDEAATTRRARALGWAVRPHANQLLCLLPQASSLREVVQALDGGEVSSVSLQPVTLEHAYMELLGQPLEG
ncbi:MAG: ABC transporter ATP-binding protein [Rhodoferax sp.]|nr:ABC transporter ATP-binding protein [Rhodoferax sp.]